MGWQEVSTGRFERPLDLLERFFVAIASANAASGKDFFSFNLILRLQLDPALGEPLTAIRNAWAATRLRYPEIAATQDGEKKHYVTLSSKTALDEWASQTCVKEPAGRSPQDVLQTFRLGDQVSLHIFETGELLLHTPHYLLDALACMYLLDHFLAALATGPGAGAIGAGQEHTRLQPSVEEVATFDDDSRADERAKELAFALAKNSPSAGINADVDTGSQAFTANASLKMSPATTTALFSACKSAGVGITAAMHAALIRAVGLRDPGRKYSSVLRVNLRNYLPSPYDSSAYPVNPAVSGMPATLDPAQPFTELAKELQGKYSDQTLMGETLRILKGWCRTVFAYPPPPDAPPPTQPDFNSIGLVERVLKREYGSGSVKVLDFWLGSEQILTSQEVYQWTFRDQLNLVACFNGSMFKQETVQRVLEETKSILMREMKVTEL